MEEQGMERRKRYLRPGLLACLPLLLALPFAELRADEGELSGPAGTASVEDSANEAAIEPALPLEIRIETAPANPVVNNPWAISLLVNHPIPSQVNVTPPRFPSSLVLERIRTETRAVAPGGRWTRVEFLFTPQRAGTLTVGAFEVSVPDRKAVTAETSVRFREAAAAVSRYNPRFRWAAPVPSIPAGSRGELQLELSNWDPLLDAPAGVFGGSIPENVILEEAPPVNTGAGAYLYAIGITPLESGEINIEPVSFQASSYSLSVPGIKVSAPPAPREDPAPAKEPAADPIAQGPAPDYAGPLAFPEIDEKVFPLLRGEYRRIIGRAKALWEGGGRARALAELRGHERDSLAGPFLVALRREAEHGMGLGLTEDEKWRPFRISLLSWAAFSLVVIAGASILLFFRGKNYRKHVTSRRRSGFITIIILVFSVGLVFIVLEEGLGNFLLGRISSRGNQAVLERTPAYRVPDEKGAVNLWFSEGQPVIVGDYRLNWCYAETSDGRSGWVKRESVCSY